MKEKKIKRRINKKRVMIAISLLVLFIVFVYSLIVFPIKNIYIVGNKYVSDKEIISLAGITNYPSFIKFNTIKAKKNILNNNYIKEVSIKKKLFGKVYIYVTEEKVLCEFDNKLYLSNGLLLENKYNILGYPLLNSNLDDLKSKFIKKISLIDNSILIKISEIDYIPNDVDKERFLFRMDDDNLVYITLNKIDKINKYNDIVLKLENKKGVIYLDSGDYVEVRDNN